MSELEVHDVIRIAIVCSSIGIMLCAAGFHFYWGAGGLLGRELALPQTPDGKPIMKFPVLGAIAVGFALVGSVVLLLGLNQRINLRLPIGAVDAAGYISAGVFAARGLSWHRYVGLFKKVRGTPFGRIDTVAYSPLCLVVSLGFLISLWQET